MAGISNHYDVMTYIKTLIDQLVAANSWNLTSVIQEVPNYQDKQIPLPMVSIAPWGPEKGDPDTGFISTDELEYPTLVAILSPQNAATFEQRLGWRQQIRRKLNNRQLPGNTQVYTMYVRPGNIVEPGMQFDRLGFASSMMVMAKSQEPRIE